MKLKQNLPLRLKINNTPTLLKPYSDKLLATNAYERQITSPKSDYPILIPANATHKSNKNTFYQLKKNDEEKKEEVVIISNIGGLNTNDKIAKNKDSFITASDSITKYSSLKNNVNFFCFIIYMYVI